MLICGAGTPHLTSEVIKAPVLTAFSEINLAAEGRWTRTGSRERVIAISACNSGVKVMAGLGVKDPGLMQEQSALQNEEMLCGGRGHRHTERGLRPGLGSGWGGAAVRWSDLQPGSPQMQIGLRSEVLRR